MTILVTERLLASWATQWIHILRATEFPRHTHHSCYFASSDQLSCFYCFFKLSVPKEVKNNNQTLYLGFLYTEEKSAGQTPSLNLFTIDFSINKEIYLCLSLIRDKTVSINKFETTNLRPKANSLEKCGNCMTKYHKSTIPSLNCMFQNSEFFWF